MNYTFFIREVLDLKVFSVKFRNGKSVLERFNDAKWTPSKIQDIIVGVEDGKTKSRGEEYIWANEDVTVYVNEHGVFFIDMLAQRGGETNPKNIGLQLGHKEFLQFLEDFKAFVKNNS